MKISVFKKMKQHPAIQYLARKTLSVIPLSNRFGKDFWSWYLLFNEMETWSYDKIKEYQINQLRLMLHAVKAENVYYGKYLRDIEVDSIQTPQDFTKIFPTTSRIEYHSNYAEIKSQGLKGKFDLSSTSGSTGTALQFYHSRMDNQREWAAICHQWKRVGYDPAKSVRAEFRGLTSHRQLVQKFPDMNMIRCSVIDINASSLSSFAHAITTNGADFYHGYPSALYLLAKEINNCGKVFPQPKGLLLASEQVYQWQLDEIIKAFPGAKIMAHYGCAERTVLAAWCELDRVYHVLPQYSLVEIDDSTNEIIGTNLFNTINPFIRYRMTDSVLKVSNNICEKCRRPYLPLIQLSGRSEDFLFSPERGWISPAIVTYPLKNLAKIREIRFIQDRQADITVEYTTHDGSSQGISQETSDIKKGLLELTGDLNIRFEHVPEIERTATGKFKWIVSEYWNSSGNLQHPKR